MSRPNLALRADAPMRALQAVIHSPTDARCGDLQAKHRTPIFALARKLIAAGHEPCTILESRWASTETASLKGPLGKLAALTVIENESVGPRFTRYSPLPPSLLRLAFHGEGTGGRISGSHEDQGFSGDHEPLSRDFGLGGEGYPRADSPTVSSIGGSERGRKGYGDSFPFTLA